MKNIKRKSGFVLCLSVILGFLTLASMIYYIKDDAEVATFFVVSAGIFLMILPACSTQK